MSNHFLRLPLLLTLAGLILAAAFSGCAQEEVKEPEPEPLPVLRSFTLKTGTVTNSAPPSVNDAETSSQIAAETIQDRILKFFESLYLKPETNGGEEPSSFFADGASLPQDLELPSELDDAQSKKGDIVISNVLVAFDAKGAPQIGIADVSLKSDYRRDRDPAGKMELGGTISMSLTSGEWRIFQTKLKSRYWLAEEDTSTEEVEE